MEAKDNRKRAVNQIKRIAASKLEPNNFDSDTSAKVPHKQKASTGILQDFKNNGKKNPKNTGS